MEKLSYMTCKDLTFRNVYQQISQYRYADFYSSKQCKPMDEKHKMELDNRYGCPFMNEIFYDMVICEGRIPMHTEFIDYYKRLYCEKSANDLLRFNKNAMERGKETNKNFNYTFEETYLNGKLMRAYMSFLKELYVLTWLWEHEMYSAYWSFKDDTEVGFDIRVSSFNGYEERKYGIKIYAATRNAKKKAEIKANQRHKNHPDITSISLISVLSKEGSTKLGDTYLFNNNVLYGMLSYIKNTVPGNLIIERKEEIELC